MTINFRETSHQDISLMTNLIKEAWYEDDQHHDSDEHLNALAEFDLNHHLNTSTFGLTAELNDKPVGFILAGAGGEEAKFRMLQTNPKQLLDKATFDTFHQPDIRAAYLMREHQANTQMLADTGIHYDAEIKLFIVSDQARGTGIGSQLYQKTLDHFKDKGVKTFFLYTDDDCSYQFYEHRQLRQAQYQPYYPADKREASHLNFYLYDNLDDTINIRPAYESDTTAMIEMIHQAWYKNDEDSFATNTSFTHALAELDLDLHLNHTTNAIVAEQAGKVVGAILLSAYGKEASGRMLQTDPRSVLTTIIAAPAERKTREADYTRKEIAAYDAMFKELDIKYEGEIQLLIVDEAIRGQGIGKQLFQAGLAYFEETEVTSYHLYTDDDCIYQFYDHQGLRRAAFEPLESGSNFNFYIYDNLGGMP